MVFDQEELRRYAEIGISEDADFEEVSKMVIREVEGSGEEDPKEDQKEEDQEEDDSEKEDEKKYSSVDDLLEKTGTTISIQKVGTEPSPIFGPGDTKPHNKFKVVLRNKNGNASFIFWDSLYNTQNGIEPKKEEMIYSIGMDCVDYGNSMSLEEFRENFGYDEADADISQKSYDGLRKTVEDLKKMFPDGDYEEFVDLASTEED